MTDLVLAYQREIYLDYFVNGGLLVLGEGLGAWDLLVSMIKCYATPKLLVFVLGLTYSEESLLLREFTAGEDQLIGHVPFNVITNETNGNQRTKLYAGGGVISTTSRIMLTDLLMDRLPAFIATGICVYRAERVTENSLEAFILHLFRQKNDTGFIKAISENPEPFTQGFNQLEKMMKWLKLPNNVLLYPRFHQVVKSELDYANVEVSELLLSQSARSRIVQMALVDLIDISLKELIRINPFLDQVGSDQGGMLVNFDAVLGRQFDVIVRQQLEPVWHQISFRTRQLVSELATLRALLTALFTLDAVSFLKYLETILSTEVASNGPNGNVANWIVLDSANTLIKLAKERVYGPGDNLVLEEPPKWKALLELLAELKDMGNILIMVDSESIKRQLEVLVSAGPSALMKYFFEEYKVWKETSGAKAIPSRWPSRKKVKKMPTVKEESNEATDEKQEPEEIVIDLDAKLPDYIEISAHSESDGLGILSSVNPDIVILYTQNLAFIRQIEIFTALKRQSAEKPLQVYSMYYKDSTEEQAYLLAIRREKNAFEALIKAKAELVLPEEGRKDLEADQEDTLVESRAQGRSTTVVQGKKLIIDMRELRSSLPFVLHRTDMFKLVPETITIGDYLLTPDCAVERKAIPDLIQSLASGRLFSQTEALCKAYTLAVLLIEFDESRRAFSLLGLGDLRSEISGNDVLSKLVLLLIHFPKLRVIWSSSLQATANIFGDIQREQPDPQLPDGTLTSNDYYSSTPKQLLECLPGVTHENLYKIMNKFESMKELCNSDLESIQEAMGPANGQAFFNFIHAKHH